MTSPYAAFPVQQTIDLRELSDIRHAVDTMVEAYASQGVSGSFSYRLLLPRGEGWTGKAKRIGIAFQGEFILELRRKSLVPNIREVRYLHDETHYGWLLANPSVFERFEKRI